MIARPLLALAVLLAIPSARAQEARQAPALAQGVNSLGLPGPRTGKVEHNFAPAFDPSVPPMSPGAQHDSRDAAAPGGIPLRIPAGYVGFRNAEAFAVTFSFQGKDVALGPYEIVTLPCGECQQVAAAVATQVGSQTITDTTNPAARDLVILHRIGNQLRFARQ